MKWKIATILALVMLASMSFFILNDNNALILVIDPPVGSVNGYAVHYESNSETATTPGSQPPAMPHPGSLHITLSGKLFFRVVSKSQDETRVEARLQLDRYTTIPSGSSLLPGKVIPFEFVQKKSGAIGTLEFQDRHFQEASSLIVEIMRQFDQNFPQSPLKKGSSWKSKEESLPTAFATENVILKIAAESALFEKRYHPLHKGRIEGVGTYHYSAPSKTITGIDLTRSLTSSNFPGMSISNRTLFKATLIAPSDASQAFAKLSTLDVQQPIIIKEDLRQSYLMSQIEKRTWQKILGQDTVESVKERLQSASAKDRASNMGLYQKLKALLALHPETALEFIDFLVEYDTEDDRFKLLATSLTAVGSSSCQEALRTAIERIIDEEKKIRLIPNLSFTHSPDSKSEDFVRNLSMTGSSEAIQGTAHLAMGTIAHQLRDQDSARSERIHQQYADRLSKATQDDEVLRYLNVLGNIGSDAQLGTIKPYLESKNPEIQAKAYESLRHVRSDEAERILIQAVLEAKDAHVKEMASDSLAYNPIAPSSILEIDKRLYAETNIQVLKNLLKALANNEDKPESRNIIKSFVDRCGHPDLCSFARSLAASLD